MLKTLAILALGSAFLVACGADKDESSVETDTPSPAVEMPAPPTDATESMPSDEPGPAISDTLPTTEEPPPPEPAPPPGG